MLELIDTHAHLDEIEDLPGAISRARNAGVAAVIAVGSNYRSNCQVLEIAATHGSFVYPALGLHPWELRGQDSTSVEHELQFIEDNIARVVGIGEVGLDYHKRVTAATSKELQKEAFLQVLYLAKRFDKPVLVHSRYAWKDALTLVKQVGTKKAVFHWFTGFSSVLRDLLAEGYFISATPAAEYHQEHRRAIKEAPLDLLLLETDSPVEYGRETRYRSEPADMVRALDAVSLMRGDDRETLARQTTANARALLGI